MGSRYATWSYRNSTAFDRSSGTEQLHRSHLGETFCAAIAVSRTDSIALADTMLLSILSQTNSVDMPLPKYLRYVLMLLLYYTTTTYCLPIFRQKLYS